MGYRLTLLAFVTVFSSTLALAGGATGPFVEKKGVQELTGMMIVRPMQIEALTKRGYSLDAARIMRQRALDRLQSMRLRFYPEVDEVVIRVPRGSTETTLSEQLMRSGEYEYAVPNWKCYPVGVKVTPNDPLFGNQWHHVTMRSAEAWYYGKGKNNVTVAIIDTGVNTNHPDLRKGIVPGFNSVDRRAQVDGGQVNDLNGHGTHVAGDAAAQGNNSTGLVGCGWNFKIMPIRTSNEPSGGAYSEDIMAGARWAIDHGAKVASASYAGVDDPTVGTTGTYCKSKGGLFLYAAGNDARNLSAFSYADTIVVGATNSADVRAGFSAYGKGVSLFAPGQDIYSTTIDGGYGYASGTSMSTPVANGACALIWSINPTLEPDDVQEILYTTCDKIGDKAVYSNGRINLYAAARVASTYKSKTEDLAPIGIATIVGSHKSGTLQQVQTGTGAGYLGGSTFDINIGSSNVVQTSFKLPVNASNVKYMEPTFQVKATPGLNLTAQIYLYDTVSKRYTLLKSQSVPRDGSTVTLTTRVDTNFARFIATNRDLKSVVRVLSPIGRRGEAGGGFNATVKFNKLRVRIKN